MEIQRRSKEKEGGLMLFAKKNKNYPDFVKETGYGNILGLCGV